MTQTIYALVKDGFERNPKKTRLNFTHPQVRISANKARCKNGSVDLTEVWFRLLSKEPITEDQVRSAISLFHPPSEYVGGGFTHYTETKSVEDSLHLNQIPSFYADKRDQLRSISDEPPRISINDNIIDGPVQVPDHKWGSVYCAFENFDPQNPEFGYSWNSVVLCKDGMALRIAKQANLIHAISPTLADIAEKVDAETDAEMELAIGQVAQFAVEQDGITSEKDVFRRLMNTPQPIIMVSELDDVAAYASGIAGMDVKSLEYQVKSPF